MNTGRWPPTGTAASYARLVAASRDTFLAELGHDLRNPLNALGSCLQVLGCIEEAATKARMLQIARRSVEAIDEMVTNLLEYTRTRLGLGLEVHPTPGDFAALCRQAFDEVCTAYPKRRLQCDIPGEVPLAFDAARMRQVLTNLLGNAVHHGDPAFPVLLEVRSDQTQVTVVVKTGARLLRLRRYRSSSIPWCRSQARIRSRTSALRPAWVWACPSRARSSRVMAAPLPRRPPPKKAPRSTCACRASATRRRQQLRKYHWPAEARRP